MIERVKKILREKCFIDKDKSLVVGVSGGPDSLCLLWILSQLEYNPIVCYLDHAIRDESLAEVDFVREVALNWKLKFFTKRIDVKSFASEAHLSIEEAARQVRYQFLFQVAEQLDAQGVAVGHHADDQVETVLMHLLRGSGLAGLKGMAYRQLPNAWSATIPLLRPMLDIWREEINACIEKIGVQPVIDLSNRDQRYYRNRLRHELLPFLQSYNPQVKRHLWQMAVCLGDDFNVVEASVNEAWKNCLLESGDSFIGLSWKKLNAYPPGIQRHLLRKAIYLLRPNLRDVNFAAIQRGLNFIAKPPRSNRCDLLADIHLLLEEDCLWIMVDESKLPTMKWPQIETDRLAILPLPGVIVLSNGWTLRSEFVNKEAVPQLIKNSKEDPFQTVIDAETVNFPLEIRSRRPGDRFQPLGLDGKSLKLSDLMINEKVPRRVRDGWPLVLSQGEIIWVPGLRPAHFSRVKDGTKSAVRLKMSKPVSNDQA